MLIGPISANEGRSVSPDKSTNSSDKLFLAPELIQARERLGLTQAQLSVESGVSLSAIKGYETGRTFPGARELRQLCMALRITPNKLLFGAENPFSAQKADGDGAKFPGMSPVEVHRWRIKFLADLLTADECAAFYALMSSMVLARHGSEQLDSVEESADLFAGAELIGKENFDISLFRRITNSPETARQLVDGIKSALATTEQNKKGDI